jgi:hypothetical protein
MQNAEVDLADPTAVHFCILTSAFPLALYPFGYILLDTRSHFVIQ